MCSHKHWMIALSAIAIWCVFYAPDVFAQDQTQQRFTGILDAFRDNSIRWQGTLISIARWVFFTLAVIQFAWTNFMLALKGGDLSDFISTNTKQILGIGVMYVFLVHSFEWSHALIKGFMQAGERSVLASGAGAVGAMDPAQVFQDGLAVAGSLFDQMSIWSGVDNLSLVICALVIIACFALLAAFMAVAIVESYIIIGGAVLFIGFGGSSWTGDIAKKAMMYAISVGAKLFVMQLIVGVTMGSVISWATTYKQDSSTSTLALIGLVMLITICAKSIPELVQGVLSGVSSGGTSTMVGTIAAGVAAAAAGGAAIGSGAAASAGTGATGGMGAIGAGGVGGAASATGASSGLLSSPMSHLGRMGGYLLETGSGLNPNSALGPLSGVSYTSDISGGGGEKPTPPGASSETDAGASTNGNEVKGSNAGANGGGIIRGAGIGTASSSAPSSPMGASASAMGASSSAGSSAKASPSDKSAKTPTTPDSTSATTAASGSNNSVPGAAPPASGYSENTQTLDDRAVGDTTAAGENDTSDSNGSANLASSQLADNSSKGSTLSASSHAGGAPQVLDERANNGTAVSDGNDTGGLNGSANLASSQLADSSSKGATLSASSHAGGAPQVLDERVIASGDNDASSANSPTNLASSQLAGSSASFASSRSNATAQTQDESFELGSNIGGSTDQGRNSVMDSLAGTFNSESGNSFQASSVSTPSNTGIKNKQKTNDSASGFNVSVSAQPQELGDHAITSLENAKARFGLT